MTSRLLRWSCPDGSIVLLLFIHQDLCGRLALHVAKARVNTTLSGCCAFAALLLHPTPDQYLCAHPSPSSCSLASISNCQEPFLSSPAQATPIPLLRYFLFSSFKKNERKKWKERRPHLFSPLSYSATRVATLTEAFNPVVSS